MTMVVRLVDAPVGLFEADGVLVMKTKYITKHDDGTITPDCYIVESGEYFWGGAKTIEERNNLEVVPVDMSAIIRRWISAKEKLPEWQDDVLVHHDGGRIDISWVDSLGNFPYQNLYGRVTHWMPLPAPPDHFRDVTKKVHDNANEPLTLEQLQEIVDPTPVWWDWIRGWMFARKGMVASCDGRYHDVRGLRGNFYRRPPEGEEDT